MKKKSREINIFNMSMLDVLSCALGAFLLIMVVLMDNSISFTLLGINTKAKSFVFAIDMSGSMQKYKDIITDTFDKTLKPFSEGNDAQIIGFQGEGSSAELHSWTSPYNLKKLTKENKDGAKSFVKSLMSKVDGGTPTRHALEEALKYDVDAIIIFTDGNPNGDPQQVVAQITKLNAGKKEIHCIAIGDYKANSALVTFLEELSKQNKGGFIGVAG